MFQAAKGFSLVELLVSLAVLSVLTTIALRSTESLVSQTRRDASSQTLESVQQAVAGDQGLKHANNRPLLTGFVADLGRLPIARGNDPLTQLNELWLQGALPALMARTCDEEPDLSMSVGWRSSAYLQLGFGESELKDGRGRNFELRNAGSPVTNGLPIESLFSAHLNDELDLVPLCFGEVTVTLSGRNESQTTEVIFFEPQVDGSEADFIALHTQLLDDDESTCVFSNKSVGTRYVRAYQPDYASATSKSQIVPVYVLPGSVMVEVDF